MNSTASYTAGKTTRISILIAGGNLVLESIRTWPSWGMMLGGILAVGVGIGWSVVHDRYLSSNPKG